MIVFLILFSYYGHHNAWTDFCENVYTVILFVDWCIEKSKLWTVTKASCSPLKTRNAFNKRLFINKNPKSFKHVPLVRVVAIKLVVYVEIAAVLAVVADLGVPEAVAAAKNALQW